MDAVAVVVPVHDEASLLPACLEALENAIGAVPASIDVRVVLVLDACRDESTSIARSWARKYGHSALDVESRNVGRARAQGIHHALDVLAQVSPSRLWLTTTDADSVVPPVWLAEQVRLAEAGAHAFAGAIDVDEWGEYPAALATSFLAFYEQASANDVAPHVHGANLGVRADAYLAVGGFEPLATGEDRALWAALRRADVRRVWSRELAVKTSSRTQGRAPAGFAAFLRALAVPVAG